MKKQSSPSSSRKSSSPSRPVDFPTLVQYLRDLESKRGHIDDPAVATDELLDRLKGMMGMLNTAAGKSPPVVREAEWFLDGLRHYFAFKDKPAAGREYDLALSFRCQLELHLADPENTNGVAMMRPLVKLAEQAERWAVDTIISSSPLSQFQDPILCTEVALNTGMRSGNIVRSLKRARCQVVILCRKAWCEKTDAAGIIPEYRKFLKEQEAEK